MRWWLRAAVLSLLARAEGSGQSEPRAVVGRVGESAVLGCSLLGAHETRPPLYVIEWVRFGFVLPIFIKFGLYSPRVDPEYIGRVRIEEGASLRIDLLRAEDQGWYECRVLFLDQHSADADFQNGTWIHLTVNAPPTFLETPPAFVEVRDQDPLSLTCTAVGNPQPVVVWKRSDVAVQSGDTVQVRNGTLSFAVVERASAGTYTCHASSKEGTVTHTTRVLVQGPPVIVVPPQNVTVNISQDAFLACQAEAYPGNLTYSWFQGSTNVFHLSRLRARVRVLVDGSLLLQQTTPDDAGKYTCIPSNGLWKPPSASAFVTVLYPAQVTNMLPETPLPKGLQGVIRCPTRANPPLLSVSWTRDGRPLELGKLPGWSARPDGSIVVATGNDDALGLYTCTPYNSYGTAGESRPTRVLLKDPPAFTVRPKEEYFQEVGRELVIPCAANGDPPPTVTWLKVGSTGTSGAQVDGNSSLVFRPLIKEQHGIWECTATNQVASVSTATSVHVLGTSPHAVTNVSVLPLLLAANISWEPGFDGGYFQRFSVWYTPLAKPPHRAHHDWVSLSVPVGAQHLLVENLQPDTSYQFSVLAQNKLGSGPFSQIVTSVPRGFPVTTVPPEPPAMTMRVFLSPPQALTANETVRGVLLQWEPPAQFSVALSGYALELRQDKGGWEVLDRSIPGTNTQVLVPGLIKDAFYEFRLVAFAGSYISDPSNTVNVSTAGMEVYPSRTQLPELLPQPVLAGVIGGICFLSVAVIFSTMAACIMNRRRATRIQKRRQDPPLVFSPSKKLPPPHNSHGSGSPDSTVKLKLQPSPCRSLRRTLLWGEKAGTSLGLSIAGAGSRYAVYESHVGEHVPLERICRGPDGRFVVETDTRLQESSLGALPYEPEPYPRRDPPATQPEPYLQLPPEEEEEEEEEPIWRKAVSLRQPRRRPRAAGHRQGRYFGYGSSSPVDEAAALCIVNISPVASAATLPYSAAEQPCDASAEPCGGPASALWDSLPLEGCPRPPRSPPASPGPAVQSGILQYLSLPFFKEMSVDGEWPPQDEPAEPNRASRQPEPPASPPPPGSPQTAGRTLCPDCIDTRANATSTAFLQPPPLPLGPAKASLPGTAAWAGSPSPGSQPPARPAHHALAGGRTEVVPSAGTEPPGWAPGKPPEPAAPEKLPRGSLTSQSSGRGSASFLRPPSLAPSLGGNCLGPPLGDGGSWHSSGSVPEEGRGRTELALGRAGKRRNTSVDENYEWDADFALESDILEALQLYRRGDTARPVSTIALRDLERQSECGTPRTPNICAPGSSSSPSHRRPVGHGGGRSRTPSSPRRARSPFLPGELGVGGGVGGGRAAGTFQGPSPGAGGFEAPQGGGPAAAAAPWPPRVRRALRAGHAALGTPGRMRGTNKEAPPGRRPVPVPSRCPPPDPPRPGRCRRADISLKRERERRGRQRRDSGSGHPSCRHGKPRTGVRPQPGGAAEDRPAVRPRAGADPGAVDRGAVRCGRGAAGARQGRIPAVAEGRHRAVPAHQQPPPAGPGAGSQDPGVHHGLQADGADLPVPAGGRALRHRRHRHLPDRRPLGREEHGLRAADPDEPGQPGGGQGRRALRGRPQLVPQEVAGEPPRLLGGQAEGGSERHRAADGHQPGRLAGRHDGVRHAPPDPLSASPPRRRHGPAGRPSQVPPQVFFQDQSLFLLLLFRWVQVGGFHAAHHPPLLYPLQCLGGRGHPLRPPAVLGGLPVPQ